MTPAPFHIDTKAFDRSFFYIGPGFDIQPLLRFTHVCDTFLYANVFLDTRPAEEWYDHALAESPDIEIVGKDVEMGFALDLAFELGPEPWTNVNAAGFMSHMEIMDYFETFRRIHDLEQFSITWQLKRRSTGRRLTLRYFTCEGLQAYVALSRGGRHAPRVLCTIQTGVLESPRGMLDRFFRDPSRARPLLWVRGIQPDEPPLFPRDRRDALESLGEYPVRAMSFNHRWLCGDSYEGQRTAERHCAGFMTRETAATLKQAPWRTEYHDERHAVTTDRLKPGLPNVAASDVAIMPRRLIDRLASGDARVHAWENVLAGTTVGITADQQVTAMATYMNRIGLPTDATIHILPWCLEDEHQLYRRALAQCSHATITYCPCLADLLEMKDCGRVDTATPSQGCI
jgi:hypothetical protein